MIVDHVPQPLVRFVETAASYAARFGVPRGERYVSFRTDPAVMVLTPIRPYANN
jgi:hypothetical protein